MHNGVNKLLSLIGVQNKNTENKIVTTLTKDIAINITCDAVDKYLTIFSAYKIKPLVFNFINAIERLILTPQEEMSSYIINNEKYVNVTNRALEELTDNLNITIPTNELYYICEIVKDAYKQATT